MRPKILRDFEINLLRLANGENDFDFKLTDEFFEAFTDSLIEGGKGKAFLTIEKSETMMVLDFRIELDVQLTCDVSLRTYVEQIRSENQMIIKLGDGEEELSEDVRIIDRGTQQLDISTFIYEYAHLSIPMKKVHPDLRDKDRPDLVYSSEADEDEVSDASEEETLDPRWEALKKLKK